MSAFDKIDAALGRMQDILQAFKQQEPDYYAKYPVELTTETDEQEVNTALAQWKPHLPEDYIYFLQHYNPKSLYWSNDHYISLHIYSAQELAAGQLGYSYNPVIDQVIEEWPGTYLVIASDEGDPYCIDLAGGDSVIYTAEHGTGSWDFAVAYDDLAQFLESAVQLRSLEDADDDAIDNSSASYSYCKVMLTGEGSNKLKTLAYIKKKFSCDYAQARAYMENMPLTVYKGIDGNASNTIDYLQSIGAEFAVTSISIEEFLQR